MNNECYLTHTIPPTWDKHSEILILGSFPSAKSREMQYFYGHPQNRFWRVLSSVYEEAFPETVDARRAFLLRNKIAVWDVIASCCIVGSSDSSIRDVTPNDIRPILSCAPIRQLYTNGQTASRLYRKYLREQTGRDATCLPSTSPANAAKSLADLITVWSQIRPEFRTGLI